jgi:hypothetical protein
MRIVLGAIAISAAVVATEASAQGVNLTGPYRCVAGCAGPGVAFVTQNGWELNLVNEVGQPSRGWVDYPGRLWIARAQSRRDLFPGWCDHPIRQRNDLAASAGSAACSGPPSPSIASR